MKIRQHVLLPFGLSLALPFMARAVEVTQTFSGVTTINQNVLGAIVSEFPVGTPWTVTVAWDTEAAPMFESGEQGQFPLTRFELSFQGASGTWSTAALADKASFTINHYGTHEIQFTSGWGPEGLTNPVIENYAPWSINVTLVDRTATAAPDLSHPPSGIDPSAWEPAEFKVYLTNEGLSAIYGAASGEEPEPAITVEQPRGTALAADSTVGFGKVKLKKKKTKVLYIHNTGDAPLVLSSMRVLGKARREFKLVQPPNLEIAADQTASLKVEFSPKKTGLRKAALAIGSNDPDTGSFKLRLTGSGKR